MTTHLAAGLVLGYAADLAFGDPRRGHPVAVFGAAAAALERRVWADDRRVGAAYTAACVTAPTVAAIVVSRALRTRPVGHTALVAACTWAALGGRSLRAEGDAMTALLGRAAGPGSTGDSGDSGDSDGVGASNPTGPSRDLAARQSVRSASAADAVDVLDTPDRGFAPDATSADALADARARLSHLCSRDATDLSAVDLARATVESLAENTSDAVVAPLLWGAVGGAPGIVAYRVVNTLDAMVGYRTERHARFGWASARLDDTLNVVPSRVTAALTVALAPAVGGRSRAAWRAWRRDAPAHPSPNAGPVEASAAGALGVVLGGSNSYSGRLEDRGRLGASGGRDVGVGDIRRAVDLTALLGGAGLAVSVVIALTLESFFPTARRRARRSEGSHRG